MDISVIKNQAQYDLALQNLEALMDVVPQPGSKQADQLELLGLLLEDYESKHNDIGLPDPIDAIRFRMDQAGLKQRDLVSYLGSANRVSEIMARKRPLTLRMIRALNKGLGIPAEVLIQEPGADLPQEADIDWLKFPINEMYKQNWFPGFKGNLTDAKTHAEELISPFIQIIDHQKATAILYRRANHIRSEHEMDRFSLIAWQARVLRMANDKPLDVKYQTGTVNEQFMQDIVKLSWQDNGPHIAKTFLNRHGIHLIIESHLKKTYLDGAAMCLHDATPVIALTLRHERLDNFWFTLMHELAHVALHFDGECEAWFDDTDDKNPKDRAEQEADALAKEALIPNNIWHKSQVRETHNSADMMALAKQLNIHPAIIAGRVRYETGNYRLLSRYLGNKQVRQQFVA